MRKHGQPETFDPSAAIVPTPELALLIRRHLRFGWWTLLLFLTLGLVLEGLHGFKIGWYVDITTRQHMFTLGHAHGTLLALVHIAFGVSLPLVKSHKHAALPSACLMGASLAMPAGFLLGGLFPYGGDPGLGIVLVTLGGALLFVAVLGTAINAR